MARTKKMGNAYFSLDVDFFSDKKIKILKARYGADGIAVYLYLLCEIYKNGYYLELDSDYEFILSDDLNMNCDKVKQVLAFLLERSMFDKQLFQSDAVLTSAGIQRRYQLMVKSRAVKNPVMAERYWLLSEGETAAFIKVNPFLNKSGNNGDNSEKKEENSEKNGVKEKEKKLKDFIYTAAPDKPFDNPELEQIFQLFLVCRGKNGDHLEPEQVVALRKDLLAAGTDDKERIAAANKAVAGGWKTFWPAGKRKTGKPEEGKSPGAKGRNRFKNFNEREYDYDSIEAKLLGGGGNNEQAKT